MPVQPPLGRARRAAHLAAVVHAHGRARRAGDRRGAGRPRADPSPSAVARATSTGWRTSARGASRASCGGVTRSPSGTAARRRTSARSRPRARAGRGPGRARHLVQLGAVAVRDARLARADARTAAFYPTDVLSTARDILFLWVARMVMMGLEFPATSRSRRLHPLGDPGARRPADEQVARHGHRPARRDRRARRRRRALRPAGDVLDPGRALQRGEDRSRAGSWRTSCSTPRG